MNGLFSAKGRVGRMKYFLTNLVSFIVVLGLDVVFETLFIEKIISNIAISYGLSLVTILVWLYIVVCASIKRLHDSNKSSKLAFLLLIPIIGFILILLPKGVDESNQYDTIK